MQTFESVFKDIVQKSVNSDGDMYVKRYLEDLRKYSPVTYNHSVNVAAQIFTALKNSESPKFSEEEIFEYTRGALLHDVGKLTTPQEILHGTDLTREEFSVMMQHSIDGLEVAKERGFDKLSQFIGVTHHIDASAMENNFVDAEKSRPQWDAIYLPGEIQSELSNFKSMSPKDFSVAKMVTFYDIVEALRSTDRAYQKKHDWTQDKPYIDEFGKEKINFSVKHIMDAKLPKENSKKYEVGSEYKGLVEVKNFQDGFNNIQDMNYPKQSESWMEEMQKFTEESVDDIVLNNKNMDTFIGQTSRDLIEKETNALLKAVDDADIVRSIVD